MARAGTAGRARLGVVLALLGCPTAAPSPAIEPPAPVVAPPLPAATKPPMPEDPVARAREIADAAIIVDGHVDVPWRLYEGRDRDGRVVEDVSEATATGDFDWPRARAGGLDAPFMSIYVPSSHEGRGAKPLADELIALVERIAAADPDKFALARSPGDVRRNTAAGRISLPLGMENGSPLEHSLANVAYFHERGIRYITLTHGKDNHISDSSYDTRHTHGGLSKFGKQVVSEMNRVGIMIDVSHLSDQAFWQVIERSTAPVIASHSSCRHFTPGFERNLDDAMIRAVAERGGVVMINFGSGFLDGEIRRAREEHERGRKQAVRAAGLAADAPGAAAVLAAYDAEHPAPRATVELVADHIEHVIALAGVEHVGLGSDFDGVGDSLPTGLADVSSYPNLVRVLLARGHARAELEKILGENTLRVWQAVEDHAAALRKGDAAAVSR